MLSHIFRKNTIIEGTVSELHNKSLHCFGKLCNQANENKHIRVKLIKIMENDNTLWQETEINELRI